MPIKYKIDVLAALKDKGYNTTRIRREKIFGEGTIQAFRSGTMASETLNKLCALLNCQPGDIIYFEDDPE